MSEKSEKYRERAKGAAEKAERAQSEHMKIVWREIAEYWRNMANQADRQGW